MELRWIEVDRNLREHIYYKDSTFPVDIWKDDYNTFVNTTLNCHWHNAFEYGVVLSGELDYFINGVHMRLQAGDCVFINTNTMHMARQCKGCNDAVMFTIVFPPSLFTGGTDSSIYRKYFQPIVGKPVHGFKVEDNTYRQTIVEGLNEIYSLQDTEYGYELRCLALIAQVWNATVNYISECGNSFIEINQQHRNEEKAKHILSYIHEHYMENISVDDIARHAGISRSACFRCFRRFTNKKPVEYINEYRLAHAAKMLKETNDTIAEICTACGFSSSSYFGKLFREKYAVTPLKYRQA